MSWSILEDLYIKATSLVTVTRTRAEAMGMATTTIAKDSLSVYICSQKV